MAIEQSVIADDRQTFDLRLGHQHAIEGILMGTRQ
jgi:hypothetical protein